MSSNLSEKELNIQLMQWILMQYNVIMKRVRKNVFYVEQFPWNQFFIHPSRIAKRTWENCWELRKKNTSKTWVRIIYSEEILHLQILSYSLCISVLKYKQYLLTFTSLMQNPPKNQVNNYECRTTLSSLFVVLFSLLFGWNILCSRCSHSW